MPDDAELLRHFAATRDNAAFAELVRCHLGGVYSAALRRVGGDAHLAEDVAQQVFIVLARKAAIAARHPALGAWLYTITRYEAAHAVRREQRRKAREQRAHRMSEPVPDNASAPVDWSRIAPLLDELIDRLSAPDRLAIVLRFVDQRAFAEIGGALRISEDAARMRLERALEKLRRELQRRGVTSTASALALSLSHHMVIAAPASLARTVNTLSTAGAVGAGVTMAGSLHVMSLTKITTAVAVLALAVAVWERQAAAKAESARASAEEQQAALRRQLARLTASNKAAHANAAVPPPAAPPPAAATADPTAANGDAAALAAKKSAAEMQFLTDPELQRLSSEQFRASLALRYGPLYAALRLSDAQVAEFERLTQARRDAEFALGRDRILQGLAKTDPAFVAQRDAVVGPIERELRALLGEGGFGQLQQFERTTTVRGLVDAVAGSVYYSNAPLTREQGQQLVDVFAATNTRQRGGRLEWTDLNWEVASAQAQTILAPTQFAALKALHDDAVLQQAAKQRMEKPGR